MDEREGSFEYDVYTPPIEVRHKRLKYTCGEYGLRRDGASFEADLPEWDAPETVEWWRAQCAFRGLPTSGRLEEVQARLSAGPDTMTNELVQLEKKAKAQWKAKYDADQSRAAQEYQAQQLKAEEDGVDRLKAVFDDKATRASLFKKDCDGLGRAAERMGLRFEWKRAPIMSWSNEWDDTWIVVGRTVADVEAKHAEIDMEESDRRLAKKLQREEKEKAARDAASRLHASIAGQSAKGGGWDVTGLWRIACKGFDSEFDPRNKTRTLKIYRVSGTKVSQMFGQFNFGGVEGWLRFEDPTAQKPPATSTGQKRKRPAWDSFLIPLDTKPSPECPTWSYRWRGRDDGGEGYMEHDSEEYECSITFSGKGGCQLSGTFRSDSVECCDITGTKVGMADGSEVTNIEDQWGYLYDSNYVGPPS